MPWLKFQYFNIYIVAYLYRHPFPVQAVNEGVEGVLLISLLLHLTGVSDVEQLFGQVQLLIHSFPMVCILQYLIMADGKCHL